MSGMGVQLSHIADQIGNVVDVLGEDVVVSEITHDSRQVREGTLFVAIRGELHDGHRFVRDAVERGAAAALVESRLDVDLPQIVVPSTRVAMAPAARAVFGAPDESLMIAGVTGTNGKTTVTHLLESILRRSGVKTGVIGTLGARIDSDSIPIARTTPEATDLQRLLATMRDAGCTIVLMEVSSHAIELHRSDAITFSVVGFTNLSQDHLDFHGDMEAYFEVKKRIFDPSVTRSAVVNVDDSWGAALASGIEVDFIPVSVSGPAAIVAGHVGGTATGTRFDLEVERSTRSVSLPLVGAFNVSNALVASGMAMALGIEPDAIAEGLSSAPPIAGRMEIIGHDGPFTVIVDYAHTPDAIAAVLGSLRTITSGRILALVGAGGDRDKEKRSIMGATAARLSDITIITTDNPRSEDPAAIAQEVKRGAVAQPNTHVEVVLDRKAAIEAAVSRAAPGDVVVILGKGHEQGQDIGSEILPFDDLSEARESLQRIGWTTS